MAQLFGAKLRALRLQHGMVQAELAHLLGVGQGYITNLETGKDAPSLHFIVCAARVLDVPADSLLRDTISVEAITENQLSGVSSSVSLHHFGANLRCLRIKHNLTQQDIAHQIGTSQRSYISNLEAGRKWPSPELIVRIADVFGVLIDELISPPLED